jgi:hypothetical protein
MPSRPTIARHHNASTQIAHQLDTGRAIAQPLAPVMGSLISENQKGINPLKMILHATNGGAVAQSRDWI